MAKCDVAVVGGGPAGLTAGIYLSRAAIGTKVFRSISPPSQIIYTPLLENYPGVPEIDGYGFIEVLTKQAQKFGAEVMEKGASKVEKTEGGFRLTLEDGKVEEAKAVVIATGSRPRMLGVPGEKEFMGRGVSYCATCDGALFRGKDVAIVGGGDTAADEGIFLSRLAAKVYLIHRRDRMRAEAALAEKFLVQENVEPIWESVVESVNGKDFVESVTVKNVKSGETKNIPVEGVFVFVGGDPNTEMVKGLVEMDATGYILTDEEMKTNVPGLFAAGDCRHKALRQVVTACGDGAEAAYSAQRYIEALEGREYPERTAP